MNMLHGGTLSKKPLTTNTVVAHHTRQVADHPVVHNPILYAERLLTESLLLLGMFLNKFPQFFEIIYFQASTF